MPDQSLQVFTSKEDESVLGTVVSVSILANVLITIGLLTALGIITPFQWVTGGQLLATPQAAVTTSTTSPAISDESIVEVVAQANPAVVSIVVTRDVPIIERYYERGPYGYFIPRERQQGTRPQEVAGGSGFFVSADGLIVTNRHVVSDTQASYSALTSEGEQIELEVVGRDPFLDIAILRPIAADRTFPHLQFGDSDQLQPGQTVIAIGNALGEFRNSVSVGVVSGLSRSVIAGSARGVSEQLDEVIQTDTPINPGNSGGPLINAIGQVVGVNVAIAEASENISFALPSNAVAEVVESVKQRGEIVRPFLGVRYVELTPQIARAQELPVDQGAYITDSANGSAITPDSAAERAGLEGGDIIVALNGEAITDENTLAQMIRESEVGELIELTAIRDGEEVMLEATLGRAPMLE